MKALIVAKATAARDRWIVWSRNHIVDPSATARSGIRRHPLLRRRLTMRLLRKCGACKHHDDAKSRRHGYVLSVFVLYSPTGPPRQLLRWLAAGRREPATHFHQHWRARRGIEPSFTPQAEQRLVSYGVGGFLFSQEPDHHDLVPAGRIT
jgi:hypothetical protein